MQNATALIPTPNASKYVQQLCKHWAHKLDVQFHDTHGQIIFPRDIKGANWADQAILKLVAHEAHLECRLETSSPEHLAAMKNVLVSHLDRFAFREVPLAYPWQDD